MDRPEKPIIDNERTEQLPAQEKVAVSSAEPPPSLSAEQAYAQRFADSQPNGYIHTQGYVP